jgi:uncharacterized protein with HEPN domain
MRDDRLRLQDILEAIAQIEKHTAAGRSEFDGNELVTVWVIHHLEIVGEACRGLSDGFRAHHKSTIWSDAIGFRNVLEHQYFGLDHDAIWEVVARELPVLKRSVEEAMMSEAGISTPA